MDINEIEMQITEWNENREKTNGLHDERTNEESSGETKIVRKSEQVEKWAKEERGGWRSFIGKA